jgi:hypothetical protein
MLADMARRDTAMGNYHDSRRRHTMTIYPSADEYAPRKVSVLVDGFPVIEMMVWADSPEQAAYQVCRVGRSIMRAHLDRLPTIKRYGNAQQKVNDDDAGVEST